ncbi:hypothetical protein AgCh_001674 [Apium graveolens]
MAKSEATPVVPSSELLEWPRKDKHGFLNVVSRVGDLVRTIKFYTESFGMKLLRKRDIPEEKNANAFLGFGPKESQFVVDLTYNMFKPYIVTWTLTIPVDINSIAFLFDGCPLRGKQSPDDLEMENGDEIDAMLHHTGGTPF